MFLSSSCFSALQGVIIQEDNTQDADQKLATRNTKTNAKLTTNTFPELISKTVQAEARNGRNLSLLIHAVGLDMRWFITQKWHWDTSPPQEQSAADGGGSIHSSRFLEKIAQNLRNLRYISSHKSNKGIIFLVFLNYLERTVSLQ